MCATDFFDNNYYCLVNTGNSLYDRLLHLYKFLIEIQLK